MKKLVIFLMVFLFISFSYALKVDYFEIKLDKPYKPGNTFIVKPIDIDKKIIGADFYLKDEQFKKINYDGEKFLFEIPSKINPSVNKLKITLYFADNTKQDYIYDIHVPYYEGIDVDNLSGGGKFQVYGSFSGSCYLMLGDKKLSLSKDKASGKYYFTIPKTIDKLITNSYVVCDDITSNEKSLTIYPSPKLYYVITKGKKVVSPGDTIIVKADYIKLKPSDKIKLLLNGKELKFKFIDDNTLETILPYKNLDNASLQVIRNGLTSNIIKLSVRKYPKIYTISTNNKNGQYYFRLYGDFDFKIGKLVVKYAGKELSVIRTGHLQKLDYIDVAYPKVKFDTKGSFTCNYYLYPSYFYVFLGGKRSNGFFYEPDNLAKIVSVERPSCGNGKCSLSFNLNKNIDKFKVLLDGVEVDKSNLSNLVKLYPERFPVKGKIELVFPWCIKTTPYYFDFTDSFKPVITSIESKYHFKPVTSFVIKGENLTRDGFHNDMKLNVKFTPAIVNNKNLRINYSSIEGDINSEAEDQEEVIVDLSNINGQSNGGYFIINGDKKYLGNPIINLVSYPDGAFIGNQVTIYGKNFDERNCLNNEIYVGNKVVYPQKCDFNKLVFTITDEIKGDEIYIKRNGKSSLKYKLYSTIGGEKVFYKFDILPSYSIKKTSIAGPVSDYINFKIQNPISDIYISKLIFKLKFDKDYLPAGDFVLYVNGDDKKYDFNPNEHKLIKTNLTNVGRIKKEKDYYLIEFSNIFIPFSSENIEAKIKFTTFESVDDGSKFSFELPRQKVLYKNIYDTNEISTSFDLEGKKLLDVYVKNKQNICFDADSTFKNCALVLNGKSLRPALKQDTKIQKKQEESKKTKVKIDKKTTSRPALSKKEKIAKKLNSQKMELLNKVIKNFIIKMKNKYWGDKARMRYILEMYKGYKKMKNNTIDNYSNKLEYVDGLMQFARAYFTFMKMK